jgi:hypothetical protein
MAKLKKKKRKKLIKLIMDEKNINEADAIKYFDRLNHWNKKFYIQRIK